MQRVIAGMSCLLLLSGCGSRVSVDGTQLEPFAAVTGSPVPEPTALPSVVATVPPPTAVPSPPPAPQPSPVAVTPVPQPAPAASPSPTPLAMPWGEWVLDLSSIGMTAGDEDVEVTLAILEERGRLIAGGRSGCNSYGSEVALDGGTWSFTGDGVTSSGMGCPPKQMAVEEAYMDRFLAVTRWSMSDGVLLLHDTDATPLRFTAAG